MEICLQNTHFDPSKINYQMYLGPTSVFVCGRNLLIVHHPGRIYICDDAKYKVPLGFPIQLIQAIMIGNKFKNFFSHKLFVVKEKDFICVFVQIIYCLVFLECFRS